ncbi:N-acetylmuramoyl-L-alanine amidase CwlD [Clostridium sp. 'White wine YQ']|uniref:N-acetylmuramoyl-L-alanine amidase CwlD n=1 Tax=Clostridium sp. 'White wine YQ' TaxID=3027474 RepID=UPI0023654C5F|nr:N-acetylmuramoyl-L-alanine amidase CwlD [Clostridium sp. 'White wine YQ']MDD7795973.1 N-acetylmuramoyl-L-alanine amidase CwlD [Clostridium sp. 'White wine YQ']
MKRIISTFLIIISIFFTNINLEKVDAKKKNETVILIDPGHGGIDGGAKSKNGTSEKNINLNISIKLKERLEKEGYKVFLTREDDKGLYSEETKGKKKVEDLKKRCAMKKETNCDIFISIHQNMFPKSGVSGAQVWHASNEESKKLALILQESLKNTLDKNNNRVPKDAKEQYRILRDNYPGPNVLVECGFLSNSKEEELLKDEKYQEKISDALKDGINEYYKQ